MNTNRNVRLFLVILVVATIISSVLMVNVFNPESSKAAAHMPSNTFTGIIVNVMPDSGYHAARPDACRTYLFGGYDAASGVDCGPSVESVATRTFVEIPKGATAITTHVSNTPVVTSTLPPTTPAPPVITSTPLPPVVDHTNNGNHYGNDRADNNPNDVNNKHNGCNTNCTGNNNNGNGKGKSK